MNNNYLNNKKGFSILEVILSVVVFTIGMFSVALLMIDIFDSSEQARALNQAVLIAEEGIEIVKSIRSDGFENLYTGSFVLKFNSGLSKYELLDIGDVDATTTVMVSDYKYDREIIIDDNNIWSGDTSTTTVMLIESKVTWQKRVGEGEVRLHTILTPWDRILVEEIDEDEAEEEGEEGGGGEGGV